MVVFLILIIPRKKEKGESNLFLIITSFLWAKCFVYTFTPTIYYLHSTHDMSERRTSYNLYFL